MPRPKSPSSPAPNTPRLGDIIVERLERLADVTDVPGQMHRLYLGAAHKRSIDLVSGWMADAGMSVRLDATSNVVGRYEAAHANAKTLLLGSHIDTVPNAGKYDGTLGVVTAISAVERLHAAKQRLPFAIEVVAFGDEEGVRFPGALTGSRALAGRFDARTLDERDAAGIVRRDALVAFGCDPHMIVAEARDPQALVGYIEVHIEQGPVLEAENLAVGVVTAIAGATRGRVTITGVAGHAGTVPMALRKDALAAAAAMILAVERAAAADPRLVATVGVVDVANAAVNAVPGEVSFSIDARSADDATRHALMEALDAAFADIARQRGVTHRFACTYDAPAASCDASLMAALSASIDTVGVSLRHLPSGAGHDAMSFKDVCPFAMLFVRCSGGISHNPAEFASADDIDIAARVLVETIDRLAAN